MVEDIDCVHLVQMGVGKAGGKLLEQFAAACDQAKGGAARGILGGEGGADAGGCARNEYACHAGLRFLLYFRSFFAFATRWSSTWSAACCWPASVWGSVTPWVASDGEVR